MWETETGGFIVGFFEGVSIKECEKLNIWDTG